jgi:hypothetical protein
MPRSSHIAQGGAQPPMPTGRHTWLYVGMGFAPYIQVRLFTSHAMTDLISALINNLQAIDRNCEGQALPAISTLHRETRIIGGRIQIPSFQKAAEIWLSLIRQKEVLITSELEASIASLPHLSMEDITLILNCINGIFQEKKYTERLTQFKDGVIRSAQRYGINSIESKLGNNITDAAYRAGAANATRAAIRDIEAKLNIFIASRSSNMGFESLMTDKVTLLKRSGEQHNEISASVQAGKIFIQRADILIEAGDLISRSMSNGAKETFEVLDPGFHERFHGIPAGYQMHVKKLGIPEASAAIQHITYNFTGDNSRINNNSIDNSINITTHNAALEKVAELRREIESSLPPEQKKEALEVVEAIENQFKSGTPSKPVITALLASIPHAANIATIISTIQGFF